MLITHSWSNRPVVRKVSAKNNKFQNFLYRKTNVQYWKYVSKQQMKYRDKTKENEKVELLCQWVDKSLNAFLMRYRTIDYVMNVRNVQRKYFHPFASSLNKKDNSESSSLSKTKAEKNQDARKIQSNILSKFAWLDAIEEAAKIPLPEPGQYTQKRKQKKLKDPIKHKVQLKLATHCQKESFERAFNSPTSVPFAPPSSLPDSLSPASKEIKNLTLIEKIDIFNYISQNIRSHFQFLERHKNATRKMDAFLNSQMIPAAKRLSHFFHHRQNKHRQKISNLMSFIQGRFNITPVSLLGETFFRHEIVPVKTFNDLNASPQEQAIISNSKKKDMHKPQVASLVLPVEEICLTVSSPRLSPKSVYRSPSKLRGEGNGGEILSFLSTVDEEQELDDLSREMSQYPFEQQVIFFKATRMIEGKKDVKNSVDVFQHIKASDEERIKKYEEAIRDLEIKPEREGTIASPKPVFSSPTDREVLPFLRSASMPVNEAIILSRRNTEREDFRPKLERQLTRGKTREENEEENEKMRRKELLQSLDFPERYVSYDDYVKDKSKRKERATLSFLHNGILKKKQIGDISSNKNVDFEKEEVSAKYLLRNDSCYPSYYELTNNKERKERLARYFTSQVDIAQQEASYYMEREKFFSVVDPARYMWDRSKQIDQDAFIEASTDRGDRDSSVSKKQQDEEYLETILRSCALFDPDYLGADDAEGLMEEGEFCVEKLKRSNSRRSSSRRSSSKKQSRDSNSKKSEKSQKPVLTDTRLSPLILKCKNLEFEKAPLLKHLEQKKLKYYAGQISELCDGANVTSLLGHLNKMYQTPSSGVTEEILAMIKNASAEKTLIDDGEQSSGIWRTMTSDGLSGFIHKGRKGNVNIDRLPLENLLDMKSEFTEYSQLPSPLHSPLNNTTEPHHRRPSFIDFNLTLSSYIEATTSLLGSDGVKNRTMPTPFNMTQEKSIHLSDVKEFAIESYTEDSYAAQATVEAPVCKQEIAPSVPTANANIIPVSDGVVERVRSFKRSSLISRRNSFHETVELFNNAQNEIEDTTEVNDQKEKVPAPRSSTESNKECNDKKKRLVQFNDNIISFNKDEYPPQRTSRIGSCNHLNRKVHIPDFEMEENRTQARPRMWTAQNFLSKNSALLVSRNSQNEDILNDFLYRTNKIKQDYIYKKSNDGVLRYDSPNKRGKIAYIHGRPISRERLAIATRSESRPGGPSTAISNQSTATGFHTANSINLRAKTLYKSHYHRIQSSQSTIKQAIPASSHLSLDLIPCSKAPKLRHRTTSVHLPKC